MVKPIKIFDTEYTVTIEIDKNSYVYKFIDNTGIEHKISHNHPSEISKNDKLGKYLNSILNNSNKISYANNHNIVCNSNDDFNKIQEMMFNEILNELKIYLIEVSEEEENEFKLSEIEIQNHYEHLYVRYLDNKKYFNATDIEYIYGICKHLGVDIADIILNSYITYLLTLLDIRATNLIAIGGPATGKTFSTKEALRFIPDGYKHIGTYTESFFFNRFDGEDLSRHIFYMGDLGGGVIDDEKTIITRNIFKELITDGYINRGLNIDGEVVEQSVSGRPAIVYTTVTEEIINEQEKSRSNIIKPSEPDKDKLMLFNTLYSTPGTNANSLKYIDKCVESVKGFSNHLINKINHYEFFNPYLFIIRDFFSSMNEFNRKIEEFNNMLNIVALLSEPKILEHDYYKNENGEIITTNLVLISWKNIIDCMNIFNGNNLLPTEKELLISLCKNYIPYDVDYIGSLKEYEEYVSEDMLNDDGIIRYLGIQIDNKDCFFTVKSIRKDLNGNNSVRHYNKNLSEKLLLFYENNYLIKIGNNEKGENIYSLAFDIKERIYNNVPYYNGDRVTPLNKYFKKAYPDLYTEYLNFINNDDKSIIYPSYKTNIEILDGLYKR